MKLELEVQKDILESVGYGDVLIMEDGELYLIIADTDGSDYVAINLKTFVPTTYVNTVRELVEERLYSRVARVIKSENLVLGVK